MGIINMNAAGNEVILNLTDGDREDLENAIKEAAGSLLRAESERDLRKEIAKRVKDDLEIKPALFNSLTKMYHKQNKEEIQNKTDVMVSMYETVFKD